MTAAAFPQKKKNNIAFSPHISSEPQYVYQLKKWKVKKQGVAKPAPATSSSQPDAHSSSFDAPSQGALKRSRAAARADTISISSTDTVPTKPPRKRHHQSAESTGEWPLEWPLVSEHLSKLSGIPTTNGEPPHSRAASAGRASPALEHNNNPTAHSVSEEPPPSPKPHHSSDAPPDRAADSYTTRAVFSPEVVSSTVLSDDIDAAAARSLGIAAPRKIHRQIDHNRPVDTFSKEDMADMESAADCFAALGCDHFAFQLYVTILRQHWKREKPHDCPSAWYWIVQCAHTAANAKHALIIQNIIQDEWQHLLYDDSRSTYKFLLNMLLAFVYHRNPETPNADLKRVTQAAWLYASYDPDDLKLFEYLPPVDRSLDLPLYRNILRLYANEFGRGPLTPSVGPGHAATASPRRPEIAHRLDCCVLGRVPGPFEIRENHDTSIGCIKFCLHWCEDQLHRLKSRKTSHYVEQTERDTEVTWDSRDTLFFRLWQQWKHGEFTTFTSLLWADVAHGMMGISPTQVLSVATGMIYDYPRGPAPQSLGYSDTLEIPRLLEQAKSMLRESDQQLGQRFLDHYVSQSNAAMWHDLRRHRFQGWGATVVQCVEGALGVAFPGLGTPSSSNDSQRPASSLLGSSVNLSAGMLPVARQSKPWSPTLASSLSSLDMSNFKKTGVDAAQRLRNLARRSASVGTVLSMPMMSISDLSDSLHSLSVSGGSSTRVGLYSRISWQESTQRVSRSDRLGQRDAGSRWDSTIEEQNESSAPQDWI